METDITDGCTSGIYLDADRAVDSSVPKVQENSITEAEAKPKFDTKGVKSSFLMPSRAKVFTTFAFCFVVDWAF